MSLDKTHLPAFVIQDLFQKTLVDLTNNEKNQTVTGSKELNVFGGNKQHIILLVNNPDAAFVTDQQLTFLSGILNACKLTLEDIGLLNIAPYRAISYKTISDTFNPRIIMMFGISSDTIQLPFVMPEFQRQSYNNQVYLAIPSLLSLENNKELKRKFWTVLQQIFSL
ncbi:MAG: hypothetical protein JWO92_1956 [Chitinophagaceae bacterium]|nr:hypothetical protein [Chitinophagaceae bacterium]